MASINLQKGKCNMNKALYGIPGHNYRTGKNHSNKDIDPTRTHLNKHYGPQTAQEFRDRLRSMIAEMDAKHPPKRRKKDRKVLLMMDTPSPREKMSMEDEARWGAKVHEVMLELFPGMVLGSTYHADEVHEYKLEKGGKVHISRGHTHTAVLPWTETKGLNMDAFYDFKSKALPNKINEALDKACMEMFGFPYRDGSYQKSRGDVEKMKLQSEIAEQEEVKEFNEKYIEQQDQQMKTNQEALQKAQEATQKAKNEEKAAKDALEALRGDYEALEARANEMEKKAAAAEKRAAAAEDRQAKAEGAISRLMKKITDWIDAHHALERVLRVARNLSPANEKKINRRMDETYERGGASIREVMDTETVESLLAAENEMERGTRTFDSLKTAVKEDLDIDDLEDGWDR